MAYKKSEITMTVLIVVLSVGLITTLFLQHSYPVKALNKYKKAEHHYSVFIDEDINRLYLMNEGKPLKSFPCATGKASTPSPIGYFKINRKAHWGEGFGGYFLGIDCSWGNFGIHGTTNPGSVGYPVSHGCFRMLNRDIAQIYKVVEIGTPVLAMSGCYGVFGKGMRTIAPGMYGADVLLIQNRLKELGYYRGRCDGKYDTELFKSSILQFEKANGLPMSEYITKRVYTSLGFVLIE